ncbi:centriolar coiled-coil protein of 110 kDa isoform X1 [Tachysurus vachellii]|uniref:centriolar coiled-coil protein of 110 kDa isoform X1 n=1 Tax=Tachysurus vachellii TaxID=175792 RepID=UPI00296A931C|nr:centriolar coiled-coil protein of 110 kDa isoform X1 [Tachysurus vachellii]XP_060741365.1 centriolar coiled-coil protein of 110 kDa isoform X1 [Tachysurus vachellii]XP_060741375.1 centriolar coiled-coil protein of 110 kDa isoform X1 [Tachysurus vachellii]XP_060741384.1 centriolar coiled-coil protein of 110 kDa isoform X1 [Tachysurus vachellii]XP_060741395.1 centriolar coiled-coil protein of 110 kDa isoform X1 [Tachysurus vachellii]
MENYDEFIRRQAIHIRRNVGEKPERRISQTSMIRFYGLPILPPLLNKDQKEEMQSLRESVSDLTNKRKTSSLSYVQTILESIRLQNVSTIEEFKDEIGLENPMNNKFQSITRLTGGNNEYNKATESHWNSSSLPFSQQMLSEMESHPLTSTACDGHKAISLRPFDREDSLESCHTTVLFEGFPMFGHRLEKAVEMNTGYGYDSSSLSISVDHSLIDASHQRLSSGYVTNETHNITPSWINRTEHIRKDPEGRQSHGGEVILNSSNISNRTGDIISHTPVDGEVCEEEYVVLNNGQINELIEPVNLAVVPEPSEGPYRMSLQNLLKKSQEHRRRQRLLRNQAKALKASEAGPATEHSHSDKENEGLLPGDNGQAEVKRTSENQVEDHLADQDLLTHKQDGERESIEPREVIYQGTDFLNFTPASNSTGSSNGKTSPSSNCPNIAVSPTQSTSAKSLYQSRGKKMGSMLPRPCLTGNKKFKNIPALKMCLSPARSKKSSPTSVLVKKNLVKVPVCVDDETRLNPCGQKKSRPVGLLPGAEGVVPVCKSMDQAKQIAQLELNLSSLKVLISDLESTLAESQAHNPKEAANISQQTLLSEHESVSMPASDGKSQCVVTFSETVQQKVLAKDHGIEPGTKQHEPPQCVTSLVQKMRVPEAFCTINVSKQLSERTAVFTNGNNQLEERKNASGNKKKASELMEDSLNASSLNRSYDVDTPSGLWSQSGTRGKQLTPELGGQEGVSRAKRRLQMNHVDENTLGQPRNELRAQSRTPKAIQRAVQELKLRDEHGAQVRALVEEQWRQQHEILQSLAMKYHFLRSVSFPCPSSGSRLEDMTTSCLSSSPVSMGLGSSSHLHEFTLSELSALSDSLNISQSRLPLCHRPLMAAAVKGYLTRRLLRTERVAQLIRTIKDTQLFLQSFQPPTPGREYNSKQDQVLQERVTLQLRSARFELHDLFFSVCPAERMQVISRDRQLSRERGLKLKGSTELQGRRKGSLSAATRKALERKRTLLQKKAAERTKPAVGAEERWTFVPNPRRVPKKTTPLRRR